MSVVIRERTTRALSQAWRRSRIFLAALVAFGVSAVGSPASASEPTSLETVMHGMHDKMAIQQTGDFDVDFARMMIAHHQGAIDMAKLQLLHGRDPRLRRLAQKIIVEQNQEIGTMLEVLKTLPAGSKQ